MPSWLMEMGRVSFSIYIIHFLFVWMFGGAYGLLSLEYKGAVTACLLYLCVLAFSWFFAVVINKYIEVPGIRFGRFMSERLLLSNKLYGK
jgi:peptidoglycan/LPS O-acetylase OafA/YrhL